MKRLLLFALLTASAGAQTAITINESTTVQTGVQPYAIVINSDQTTTEVLKNGCYLDCGFEKSVASVLIQVGNSNLGSSSYFVDFNDSAIILANELATQPAAATYRVWRAGVDIADGTINSNNQGDSAGGVTFTAVLSGTSLSSFSPSSAVINGIPNGTYNLEVHRGTGSGGAANMVCTGASGSPASGATCTPGVVSAGSYTVAPTINVWNGFTINAPSTGSIPGGFSVGDYVDIRQDYGPSTQAQMQAAGWGFSGSGTAVGETSDLPNDATLGDLPAGAANNQAILLTGPKTISGAFDTGVPAQNLYPLIDPITASLTHKLVSGTGVISWTLSRATQAGSGTGFSCSGTITPTAGTWVYTANYASSCTTGETVGGTGPIGQLNYTFSIPTGMVAELDNVYIAATSTGNTTAFRDPVVTALVTYGGGTNAAPTRNLNNQMPLTMLEQLQPDPRSIPNYSFGDNCNNGQPLWSAGCIKAAPITWKQHLDLGEATGSSIWEVVGVNLLGSTDGTTLAQYLGGGCGTTGGAIRCAQGHTATYLSTYAGREIHIEPGNENWNTGGSGGKWRTVPLCTASANCSADYASGANTNAPYGYYVQQLASGFQSDASYNSTIEKFELGLQTSGSNTTFGADNLFKSTATPGTPFVTAATNIDFAPYINFQPTCDTAMTNCGFDTASFSRQTQTDLANAYYNNQSTGQIAIPCNAYKSAHPCTIYEMNGGMTGLATDPSSGNVVVHGAPTQQEVNGYQNALGGGLADMLMLSEGCRVLAICGFRAHFVLLQQNKNFNNTGTSVTFPGTTTNGSNVITGVTVTPSMVQYASVSGNGLNNGTADANGTAGIWSVGTNTITLNRNVSCVTTCGTVTFTQPDIVTDLWGGAIGIGAQKVNRIRPFMLLAQTENTYAIKYGSTMYSASLTSPIWNFPLAGTCPTACNGTPATNNIPFIYAYGYKSGTFRSLVIYNTADTTQAITLTGSSLTTGVTQVVTGASNGWSDTQELGNNIVPVVTTGITFPSSLSLAPHTQTILSGNVGASVPSTSLSGKVTISGNANIQ